MLCSLILSVLQKYVGRFHGHPTHSVSESENLSTASRDNKYCHLKSVLFMYIIIVNYNNCVYNSRT